MTSLVLQPNSTAQWHALVNDAEAAARHQLGEELESYLVFLLMRYTEKPEMAASVLALEFLNGVNEIGRLRENKLRDVADKCLLYSGFFPRRAERRRVRISYFVDLGRAAYHQLSDCAQGGIAETYHRLCAGFISAMDVLQAMRTLGGPKTTLDLLNAFELWHDTGSRHAYQQISQTTDAFPVAVTGSGFIKQ